MFAALLTPCREWQGARTSGGYGHRRSGYVHRWVMAQVHGWPAIKGKEVMHLCDNPPCFRYDHLEIGTKRDNMRHMVDVGRHFSLSRLKTHCPQGHPYDEENTYHHGGKRHCRTCRREAQRRGYS